MKVKGSQVCLTDHLHLRKLDCVAPTAPVFTAKVPEELEKIIYLH